MYCSIISSPGWGKSTICSPCFFKYCLPNRVFNMGCAPVSAAKADSSSPELLRSDIFFGFSCRDAHYITRRCPNLAFELPVYDSCPLLAIDNVRMNPYCLSSRSKNRNKTLLLLVMRISIDYSWFPFRDRSYSDWCWSEILAELRR